MAGTEIVLKRAEDGDTTKHDEGLSVSLDRLDFDQSHDGRPMSPIAKFTVHDKQNAVSEVEQLCGTACLMNGTKVTNIKQIEESVRNENKIEVQPTAPRPLNTRIDPPKIDVQRHDGALVHDREAASMKRHSENTRNMENEAVALQNDKIKRIALIDDGASKSRPLTDAERKQIMHLLDLSEAERSLSGANKVPKGHKLTHERIAQLTNRHVNTISKLKRERDKQQCLRVQYGDRMQTVEIPQPKQIGGYRGSRLTEEQQRMCTRIAVENPRLTSTRIREKLQEKFPQLNTLSDTTVWRILDRSGLHFLRAKLRDPRAEGTAAHMAEKQAFLNELRKGESGELGANNLFFMDETTLYLNETARRAWGTSEHPAEIKHAKGKTVTIGVYAGLGLVAPADVISETSWKSQNDEQNQDRGKPEAWTDPRGNDFELVDGEWQRTERAPRFMLFWWLRPPARKNLVLSRFLNIQDILEPNMIFSNPIPAGKPHFGKDESAFTSWKVSNTKPKNIDYYTAMTEEMVAHVDKHAPQQNIIGPQNDKLQFADYMFPKRLLESDESNDKFSCKYKGEELYFTKIADDATAAEFSFVNERGEINYDNVEAFLNIQFDRIRDPSELSEALWLNNIEWRQVDDSGELITIMTSSKHKKKVLLSADAMLKYLDGLKSLVARAALMDTKLRDDNEKRNFLTTFLRPDVDDKIPRGFYTKNGRNYLGGRIEGERGDRALFLQYLRHHVVYIERAFPSNVRSQLNHAWDSAPQHGKTDVTKNTKSFIHRWVQKHLKVRGAIFLPVREPDFNPVELLFAFIKGVVRRKFPSERGEVSVGEMIRLIDEAFMEVTESMVKGWLRYGCYLIPDDSPEALEAIKRTERCGYDKTVDVGSVWHRLVQIWEDKNKTRIPSTIRPQLITHNQEAVHQYASRFRTVADAFRHTFADKTTPHTVKIGSNDYEIKHAVNAMQQLINLKTRVELSSLTSSVIFYDNFKHESYKELIKILHLKHNDSTGMLTILHYWAQYTLGEQLLEALNNLTRLITARDGVLSNLAVALKNARKLAQLSRDRLHVPKNTTDVELLLDAQERLFHPKLDSNRTVRLRHAEHKDACVVEFEKPSRTLPYEASLNISTTVESPLTARVKNITSTIVEFRASENDTIISAGNERICDAIRLQPEVKEQMRKMKEQMRSELMLTPYSCSVPTDDEIGKGYVLTYALAVISMKAYEFELGRIEHAVSKLVREKMLPHVNLNAPPNASAQRQLLEATSTVLYVLQHHSFAANDQTKLYDIFNLRAERRANVQLRQLAKGDPDERRWPGYPLDERDERNGRRIRTVTEAGSKDDEDDNMDFFNVEPIRSIKIVLRDQIVTKKDNAHVLITFEGERTGTYGLKWRNVGQKKLDHMQKEIQNTQLVKSLDENKKIVEFSEDEWKAFKEDNLESDSFVKSGRSYFSPCAPILCNTKDEAFQQMTNKKFSPLNYAKWNSTWTRFLETKQKATKTKEKDVKIVGVYEGVPLTLYTEQEKRTTANSFIGVGNGDFILFDPDASVFYPAPHMKISDYDNKTKPLIALWDRKVTCREQLAEYWSSKRDTSIVDISLMYDENKQPISKNEVTFILKPAYIYGNSQYKANSDEYLPAFKRLNSDLASVPALKPYNINIALPSYRVYKLEGEASTSVYQVRPPLYAKPSSTATKVKVVSYKGLTIHEEKTEHGSIFSSEDKKRGISFIMPRRAIDRMYRNKSLVQIEQECKSKCLCEVKSGEFSIDDQGNLSFFA